MVEMVFHLSYSSALSHCPQYCPSLRRLSRSPSRYSMPSRRPAITLSALPEPYIWSYVEA